MSMMARRQSEHRFGMNHVRQLFGNDSREPVPARPVSLNRRHAIPRATSLALIAQRLGKSVHSRQCPTPDSALVPTKDLQESPLRSSWPTAAAETGNPQPPAGLFPYAKSFSTTRPLTSVNRKSRPMCR